LVKQGKYGVVFCLVAGNILREGKENVKKQLTKIVGGVL
jgi:hypothetical protein